MNKLSISIISILLIIIALGTYKFILQGNVIDSKSVDGRLAILLTDSERDLVLEEMRGFLISSQQIVKAVADNNMAAAATAAKVVGRAAQQAVPGSLMGKLPMAFKKLGFDTHTKFDQLALDAEDMEDSQQTLSQLAKLMQNCIACHAAYKLEIEQTQE